VDEWLLRHNRLCPTCKQNITIQHAQDATGERSDLETGLHTTTVGSVEVIQMQVQGAVPVDTTPSPSPSPSPSPTNHASVASAGPDPPSSEGASFCSIFLVFLVCNFLYVAWVSTLHDVIE